MKISLKAVRSRFRQNRTWRIVSLLLLAILLCVGFAVSQQKADPAQGNNSGQSVGVGHQLVHESREAAGEEKDETAEFKQSASVKLVARLTGLDPLRSYWLCMITNFVAIAALIYWGCRKYLPGMFRGRTAAIQKAMQDAQKASAEARQKLAEIGARLQKLDGEIAAIRDAAEKDAAAEVARIQAAAEEDARKILAAAEQEIAAAAKAARRQLTAYAGDLAVALAQKQIRVDAATDQALVRNFGAQLGTSPENSGPQNSRKDQN
jgi:F-type H+-transporting ATPase subunit b